jgi:uncharacterized protein YjaG (DUF416 family)
MEPLRYDVKEMVEQIERLPKGRRTVFAATCAERLLPAYAAFAARTGRGDPSKLRGFLDRLWADLSGDPMTGIELQASIDASTELVPQEEDGPWVLEVGPGEDAATSVAYALRCRQSGESTEAEAAARGVYNAVDYFLVHRNDPPEPEVETFPDLEDDIVHPLMQTALARQKRDLDELLQAGEGDDVALIARLRDRARAEASSVFADA